MEIESEGKVCPVREAVCICVCVSVCLHVCAPICRQAGEQSSPPGGAEGTPTPYPIQAEHILPARTDQMHSSFLLLLYQNTQKKGVFWWVQPGHQGSHGGRDVKGLVTWYPHSEDSKRRLQLNSFSPIHSGHDPRPWNGVPIFGMSLPPSTT